MFPARLKPILAIAIASIIWGAASPIFKWSLSNIPTFTLATLRFSLAGLILMPFVLNKKLSLDKKDWLLVFLFALGGTTLNISFFFLGLKLAPSVNASIIGSIQPLILLLIAWTLLKERITKMEMVGAVISFTGILIIILAPLVLSGYRGEMSLLGNFYFVIAMLGAVLQTYCGRLLVKRKGYSLLYTFYAFAIGALTFFPFFIIEYLQNPNWLGRLDLAGTTGIIYGVLFSSLLAYCLMDWGIAKVEEISEASLFYYLNPLAAILVAILFFGEKITTPFLIGMALVITGMLLTERRLPFHPLHKKNKV